VGGLCAGLGWQFLTPRGNNLMNGDIRHSRLLPGPQRHFGSLKSAGLGTWMPWEMWAVVPFTRQAPDSVLKA